MANDASIEKIGKNITSLAKKKPGLFYGSIAGVVAIGAFIALRGKNSSRGTDLMYYSEPIEPIQTGERGLTEADIANLLAERDDFISDQFGMVYDSISDQFGMVYDDIYTGFDSIAGQLAGLAENQQRIDYSFPPNYPYLPDIPEIDYFPVDTTPSASTQSSGMSGEFSQAIADIQRNENLLFSPSVLFDDKQLLDMGAWSALDLYWQEQGSSGTSKNLPVTKDQLVVYKNGQVIVVDRADYKPSSGSSSSSSSSSSSGSSSSSSSSKSSSSSSSSSSSKSSSSSSSSSSSGSSGSSSSSYEVGYSYSAGSSSKNPPSDGGKWSYSKGTWTKVG